MLLYSASINNQLSCWPISVAGRGIAKILYFKIRLFFFDKLRFVYFIPSFTYLFLGGIQLPAIVGTEPR